MGIRGGGRVTPENGGEEMGRSEDTSTNVCYTYFKQTIRRITRKDGCRVPCITSCIKGIGELSLTYSKLGGSRKPDVIFRNGAISSVLIIFQLSGIYP